MALKIGDKKVIYGVEVILKEIDGYKQFWENESGNITYAKLTKEKEGEKQ